MKLCRFGPAGSEKPGLVDAQGKIRDLSAHVNDIDGNVLSDAAIATLKAIDPAAGQSGPWIDSVGPPATTWVLPRRMPPKTGATHSSVPSHGMRG